MAKLLIINPGSTSTKIAIYENEQEIISKNLEHDAEQIHVFERTVDQTDFRVNVIHEFLEAQRVDVKSFDAIIGRGGMLPPVLSGAYEVNEAMVRRLAENPTLDHASNLGAIIAYQLANEIDKKAYIYDSPKVDELPDLARISGMPELPRVSTLHTLNSRAMAIRAAKEQGKSYQDMNIIVAHMGGGISLSVHEKGRIIDIVSDDEGPFSPSRAGRLHIRQVIETAFGESSKSDFLKKFAAHSGLQGYLGTADARQVENMIENGDEKAALVYEAMAYQVAKSIGELATTVSGQVDFIVLTGGLAYSDLLTTWIKNRVSFITKVLIIPGENEMKALALGGLRVLSGEEQVHEYAEK